jgi:hypothetical protein
MKGTIPMTDTVFTKINAQNVEVFKQVLAQAKTAMSVDEIKSLINGLYEIGEAKAAANSDNAQRLERMNATKADPKFNVIRARTDAELYQLGLGGISDFAKSGTMKKLDEAVRASAMPSERRFTLKTAMYSLGLI